MANATKQEAVDRVTAEEVMRWMDRGEAVVFVDTRNPEAWGQSNEIPKSGPGERWIVTYCT